MAQNMENVDFRTIFTITSQHVSHLKENCDFWVPLNISDQIIEHFVQCCFIFQENAQSLQKQGPGMQYPLKSL